MSGIQKRPAAAAGGMRARKRLAANIVNAPQDTPNAVGVGAPASIDRREEHPEWYPLIEKLERNSPLNLRVAFWEAIVIACIPADIL